MKKTLKEITQQFSNSLIVNTRPDGTQFVRLADDYQEWIQDIVRACHVDWFPDDMKYKMIGECAERLAEDLEDDAQDFDDIDSGMIADDLVDIYNYDRIKWLASHLERAYYCDDAAEEGYLTADSTMFDRLGMGQYMEYSEILGILMRELQKQFDSQE